MINNEYEFSIMELRSRTMYKRMINDKAVTNGALPLLSSLSLSLDDVRALLSYHDRGRHGVGGNNFRED